MMLGLGQEGETTVVIKLFATLRETARTNELSINLKNSARPNLGFTVTDALKELGQRLSLNLDRCDFVVALNGEYATTEALLEDGDELALIPPVSGGGFVPTIKVVEEQLDVNHYVNAVSDPRCGAHALFLGVVRADDHQQEVVSLEYEAYTKMALTEMNKIATDLHARHGVLRLAAGHRVGRVGVGVPSLIVAASKPHREGLHAALDEFVVRLKKTVPIWKKENLRGD